VFSWTFEVERGFRFQPGQFNMLYAHGVGEVAISISGDPAERGLLVHTLRGVGAVTQVMELFESGDMVGVRGPYGSVWPIEAARGTDVLIVAGGIGLAPLRPAILQVLAQREAFGRVTILYGARSPADIIYREELQRWRGRFDCRVEAIVDTAGRSWYGPVGVVTRLIAEAEVGPNETAFVCGPEIMMRFVVRELERRGVSAHSIWISMERNMKCGVGLCGHCQWGGSFVCKDGPIYRFDRVAPLFATREV
jgi:NAD(P)H-flavin reductase